MCIEQNKTLYYLNNRLNYNLYYNYNFLCLEIHEFSIAFLVILIYINFK